MAQYEPVDAANRIVHEHYRDCLAAFLASGVLSEHRTPTSDLDIVIVVASGPAPHRKTITAYGWLVELFVHTLESLPHFFDLDARDQRCTLARMCTGYVVFDDAGVAGAIRAMAHGVIDAGPRALSSAEIDERRYHLTDLLDDVNGARDPDEIIFIAGQLIHQAGALVLASQRQWRGTGKWMVRQLDATGGDFADRLAHSFRTLVVSGQRDELNAVVTAALSLVGGPLSDGYESTRTAE